MSAVVSQEPWKFNKDKWGMCAYKKIGSFTASIMAFNGYPTYWRITLPGFLYPQDGYIKQDKPVLMASGKEDYMGMAYTKVNEQLAKAVVKRYPDAFELDCRGKLVGKGSDDIFSFPSTAC